MSGSLNKVLLIGNLGADPELRKTQKGDSVASLRLATSRTWTDQSGSKQVETEWHRVVIFGKIAIVAEKYLRKGSKILIEGQLRTRKWQNQSGQDQYTTEVVVSGYGGNMTMLGSKSDFSSGHGAARGGESSAAIDDKFADSSSKSGDLSPEKEDPLGLDDDIPF